jgi:hypothetical protein
MLAITAIGGIIAALGGGIFILITVVSVFFGRPMPAGADVAAVGGVPPGIVKPPAPLPASAPQTGDKLPRFGKLGAAPGTMVMVLVFLAAFVTYYFVNWKLLSVLWQVG